MHAEAYEWVAAHTELVADGALVLELGARDINGSIRDLFPETSWLGLDIEKGDSVDIVADGADWKAQIGFDAVICCEVLEHTPRARDLVVNAAQLLTRGGVFIMTCAGVDRPVHAADGDEHLHDGEFYANVSGAELADWLREAGFAKWEIDEQRVPSDTRCVAWR